MFYLLLGSDIYPSREGNPNPYSTPSESLMDFMDKEKRTIYNSPSILEANKLIKRS